jgi:hypothetical protein
MELTEHSQTHHNICSSDKCRESELQEIDNVRQHTGYSSLPSSQILDVRNSSLLLFLDIQVDVLSTDGRGCFASSFHLLLEIVARFISSHCHNLWSHGRSEFGRQRLDQSLYERRHTFEGLLKLLVVVLEQILQVVPSGGCTIDDVF